MKNSIILFALMLLFPIVSNSQILKLHDNKVDNKNLTEADKVEDSKPKFFGGGYVNFLNNGSMSTSIELLKLKIGNPNGINLPIYIFTSAARETGDDSTIDNETLINDLINPKGGIANVSSHLDFNLVKPTEFMMLKPFIHLGLKYANGTNSLGENTKFYNALTNIGLMYQTRAWKDGDSDNLGYFWINLVLKTNFMSSSNMDTFFVNNDSNKLYSFSFETGIEINEVVSMNFGIDKLLNNKSIIGTNNPIINVSLNLTSKK